MPQFLVEPDAVDLEKGSASLDASEAKHLRASFRAALGEIVVISDGRGRRWQGVLSNAAGGGLSVEQLHPLPKNESKVRVELLQAMPKGERWELILEKVTEIGVQGIWPLYTERSIPRVMGARLDGKMTRWREKLRASLKQCERSMVPALHPPLELLTWLANHPVPEPDEARFYLAERRSAGASSSDLGRQTTPTVVRIAVGPEGGWAAGEIEALEAAAFVPVSLGPRILRSDTAAVVGTALVLHVWGDLV